MVGWYERGERTVDSTGKTSELPSGVDQQRCGSVKMRPRNFGAEVVIRDYLSCDHLEEIDSLADVDVRR